MSASLDFPEQKIQSSVRAKPGILAADSPLLASSSLEMKPEAVEQLLCHVARRELKEAKALIKNKPKLLLCKGTVTDLSKREFKEITAFQYTLWALDWDMWWTLLDYMSEQDAAAQWKELEGRGTVHGKHASWQELIDTYNAYTRENFTSGIKEIRRAEAGLPAHVKKKWATCLINPALIPVNVNWEEWEYNKEALASLLEMCQLQRATLAKKLSAVLPVNSGEYIQKQSFK